MAAHLAAVAYYLDDEPEVAHRHAVFARSLATRLATVREVVGVTGYQTGKFADALSDLRAARRMTGRADMLPIMADCERGLGRPERALEMWDDPQVARLDVATRVELLIVVAGARRDMGQNEHAAVMLQVPELHRTVGRTVERPAALRLRRRAGRARPQGGGTAVVRGGSPGRHRRAARTLSDRLAELG